MAPHHQKKLSAAGLLITLGIIYGDIGTSPLYVVSAIIGGQAIDREVILGGISCVFWTLVIITTFKYVILALQADNNGEGGIFSLYALVKHHPARWPLIAALIGCAALISDGFITPPISISSAVEGLNFLFPELPTLPIVLTILVLLFAFQQFGTSVVGKTFGPVMLLWFSTLAVLGARQVIQNPEILQAMNPRYGLHLLLEHPGGFWILGAVFLCTTGGEALYADLGHCGKSNIRVSWSFVLFSLLINYFGQGAWALKHVGTKPEFNSIFYAIVPPAILPFIIILATAATIIASQALITGCFTLINEAIKQRLWINMNIRYPAETKGQIYIPGINWFLFSGCLLIVLIFKRSSNMEAAYGLAITIDMLMTSSLLLLFFRHRQVPLPLVLALGVIFFSTEIAFFLSNMKKFFYGGWVTFFVGLFIFALLYSLYRARQIRDSYNQMVDLKSLVPIFSALQQDATVPKEATNLVYMVRHSKHSPQVDSHTIYSIFQNKPRRADVYWFVCVDVLDYPNELHTGYSVETILPGKLFFVRLEFGFKVKHKVYRLFKKVVEEMAANGEVDIRSHYPSMREHQIPADFKYIFVKPKVSEDNDLKPRNKIIIGIYESLSAFSYPPYKDFGLDVAKVEVENIPMHFHLPAEVKLVRRHHNDPGPDHDA